MLCPACARCHKELKCEVNEITLVHFIDNDESKGVDAIRYGDLFSCPDCKLAVVINMGRQIDATNANQEMLQQMIRYARELGKVFEIKR